MTVLCSDTNNLCYHTTFNMHKVFIFKWVHALLPSIIYTYLLIHCRNNIIQFIFRSTLMNFYSCINPTDQNNCLCNGWSGHIYHGGWNLAYICTWHHYFLQKTACRMPYFALLCTFNLLQWTGYMLFKLNQWLIFM